MRHNKKFNHLSRKKGHRDAMLANMTISLIMHKRIFTTLAKAKALRVYAEPIINRAKNDDTASRRVVFSYLQNKHAVSILFNEIAQKIADRPGGYTRILKTGNRKERGQEGYKTQPPLFWQESCSASSRRTASSRVKSLTSLGEFAFGNFLPYLILTAPEASCFRCRFSVCG